MAMLFPDVDRSGFTWDLEKCVNKPWYYTQYSDSPEAEFRRNILNHLATHVTDRNFKGKILRTKKRHMNQQGDRPSYYALVSELIVHEVLLVNGYTSRYEIGDGKKIDFRASNMLHDIYVEVVHKESLEIDIERYQKEEFYMTSSNSDDFIDSIRYCLRDKHSDNYCLGEIPYIIAVDNQQEGALLLQYFEALYGKLNCKVALGQELEVLGYGTARDGWYSLNRDQGLYGVLAFTSININRLTFCECCFFPNPYCNYKLDGLFPLIEECYPDQNKQIQVYHDEHGIPAIRGTKLSTLIKLPSLTSEH